MRHPRILWLIFLFAAVGLQGASRPNFVWILSEDNSKHYLRLFDDGGAAAPNIERLAAEGITFDRAFSCAPVCSVARTTLMTGMFAPRVGFQFHRKSVLAHLPAGIEMWPAYLRQAGYYTSNNDKKDYNVVEGAVWDESSSRASWRNRPAADTPFFHMQTVKFSHESSLHFSRDQMAAQPTRTDPSQVTLVPYFPDTPLFRYTHARYLDRMASVDDSVGELVSQLEADGLIEDTFIFYFGDHGGVLPRSKGYLYESGLHVPLVVRIPDRWKHLVAFDRGSRSGGFVTFADFGPTLLHLAGVAVPPQLDGRPFLGSGISPAALETRDEAYGYADRFDEKYDLVRSLRKGRFKYIRNYQAFYPDALQNNYRYRMLAYEEWRTLFRSGKLNAAQEQFFKRRPAEQLFDLEKDPHEVNNLAGDPEYAAQLRDLRARLQTWVKGIHDLSFYPENYLAEQAFTDGVAFGVAHAGEIDRLVDIADLALRPFDEVRFDLFRATQSSNDWERYWALITCSVFGPGARPLVPAATQRLADANGMVRVRAAEFLGSVGVIDPMPTLVEVVNSTLSQQELLLTLNTVVHLRDLNPAHAIGAGLLKPLLEKGEFERRLEYLRQ